jgi:hypothetical protein
VCEIWQAMSVFEDFVNRDHVRCLQQMRSSYCAALYTMSFSIRHRTALWKLRNINSGKYNTLWVKNQPERLKGRFEVKIMIFANSCSVPILFHVRMYNRVIHLQHYSGNE